MKELLSSDKKYNFRDFLRIPFTVCPLYAGIKILNQAVVSLLPSLQVLATAAFIDSALDIFAGKAGQEAIGMPLLCLILIVAYNNLNWQLMSYVNLKMEMRLDFVYRTGIAQKRASLEYRHVENNDTWELINRVCADPVGKLLGGFNNICGIANIVLRVGSLLVILMAQVWWAGLAIVAISVPLFRLAVKSGQQMYEENKEAEKHRRRANYLKSVLQGRENVEERTLFGYAQKVNRQWLEKYEAARKISVGVSARYFIRLKGSSLVTVLLSLLIISVLLFPLQRGLITPGMFMGLVTSTLNLIQMMSWELADTMGQIARNLEYCKDLTAFCALSETQGALELPADSSEITFESLEFSHVTFRYPGTDKDILSDFNLRLECGRHYAFVGINGAGKTTLTKLLTGLYDNYEGEILLNGRELKTFSQAQLKAFFSVVYQDFARYQISLEDNIALGDVLHRDQDKIRTAAASIGLDQAIADLPRGMETPLGKIKENSVDLSGGQWQRVAIARALYNPAAVQILDEPTAALDPLAEREIYESFDRMTGGRTAVYISHRLASTRFCDAIALFEKGRLAEYGTHEELMKRQGKYVEMFRIQAEYYRKEEDSQVKEEAGA